MGDAWRLLFTFRKVERPSMNLLSWFAGILLIRDRYGGGDHFPALG
jgi:hypothetical protein